MTENDLTMAGNAVVLVTQAPAVIVCAMYAMAYGNDRWRVLGTFLVMLCQMLWVMHGPGLDLFTRCWVCGAVFLAVIIYYFVLTSLASRSEGDGDKADGDDKPG